ncbi:inhibitor of growth protein 1 isoform X1 [Hydra vulgaris]|uniref:Inhibitor of growth protein n=2 Tax=Hydra vulgaris TaxID=6087 RepID=T2M3W8_HYDVU|nr:inhibitor of growth protein 1-like isoform X2 [Hydra vulgaris]XP_012553510.1 inhibitor of growth protein 1-like isoform X2 [Hydra vulgaris]
MMQQPHSPTMAPNLEFIESYMDCLESLPLEIQRLVTQIREYDVLYRKNIEQISRFSNMYQSEDYHLKRQSILTKLQKCLLKSQQYADEKLQLISQMVDLTELRNQQVSRDAEAVNVEQKDENFLKTKVEKQKVTLPENSIKSYLAKRPRRGKTNDKNNDREKIVQTLKEELEEEETEEVEEEDSRLRSSNNKKKDKLVHCKVKEEDKKIEKKNPIKITKKSSKLSKSKKKKKEKEHSSEDMVVDPDEPTYCLCNSISYGDMIGCDNDDCPIEWFHFGCVNLTHKPKGKWFCPSCVTERKGKK